MEFVTLDMSKLEYRYRLHRFQTERFIFLSLQPFLFHFFELYISPEKGVPQTIVGKESEMTLQVIDDMHRYMNEEVFVNLTYATIRNDCINNHDLCAVWAALGECEANSRFMLKECAPACKSCLYLDVQYRCPMPDPLNNAYDPGDLHAMFMKIANGDWNQYKPEILSAPSKFDLNDDNDNEDNNTGMRKPWVRLNLLFIYSF